MGERKIFLSLFFERKWGDKLSINVEDRKALAEVLDVLENTDRKLVRKFPREFIEFLNQNADPVHKVMFDSSKKLKEQKISDMAKAILAIVYEKYIRETENELVNMNDSAKTSENSIEEKLLKIFNSKKGGENK